MREACPGHIRFIYPKDSVIAICTCGLAVEQRTDAPSFPSELAKSINEHLGYMPLSTRMLTQFRKPIPFSRISQAGGRVSHGEAR